MFCLVLFWAAFVVYNTQQLLSLILNFFLNYLNLLNTAIFYLAIDTCSIWEFF